jgi:hypothetical protein
MSMNTIKLGAVKGLLNATDAATAAYNYVGDVVFHAVLRMEEAVESAYSALLNAGVEAAEAVADAEIAAAERASNVASKTYAEAIVALHKANANAETAHKAFLAAQVNRQERVNALRP